MAAMQFDLVSPEKSLVSAEVEAVSLPGLEGDMTAMANHAPTLTALRPGVLSIRGSVETADYVVTGGFAEISPSGTSVLAERAMPKGEATRQDLDSLAEEAKAALEAAPEERRAAAAQRVNDIQRLIAQLGL